MPKHIDPDKHGSQRAAADNADDDMRGDHFEMGGFVRVVGRGASL